jgi:hypothetical protein
MISSNARRLANRHSPCWHMLRRIAAPHKTLAGINARRWKEGPEGDSLGGATVFSQSPQQRVIVRIALAHDVGERVWSLLIEIIVHRRNPYYEQPSPGPL